MNESSKTPLPSWVEDGVFPFYLNQTKFDRKHAGLFAKLTLLVLIITVSGMSIAFTLRSTRLTIISIVFLVVSLFTILIASQVRMKRERKKILSSTEWQVKYLQSVIAANEAFKNSIPEETKKIREEGQKKLTSIWNRKAEIERITAEANEFLKLLQPQIAGDVNYG